MANDTKSPSKALAVLAAIVPWLFAIVGTGLLIVVSRGFRGFARVLQEGGLFGHAVLAASLLSLVVLSVVLALQARGRAVPSVVVIGAIALPALVGIGGALSSLVRAAGATSNADAAFRASLLAQGIAEALNTRLVGAWCSGGLAGSAAVGLALASLAQRAPGRGGLGVGVGLVAALPLLAAGAIGIATQEAPGAFVTLLPPVALVLPVMLLAGAGIGKAAGRVRWLAEIRYTYGTTNLATSDLFGARYNRSLAMMLGAAVVLGGAGTPPTVSDPPTRDPP